MKTLFLSMLFCFVTQVTQAFVEFEIRPRSLNAKTDVVGVQTGHHYQRAIFFTGQTAKRLASIYRYPYNPDTEMIVMTGSDVADLVGASIATAAVGGGLILITTTVFTEAALRLAFNTVYYSGQFAWIVADIGITAGKTVIYYTLKELRYSVYIIADTGYAIALAPFEILGVAYNYVSSIPDFFDFND